MNASILSFSAARVKPIQALTMYVSFAKITALNTFCRHSRFRPCARNVFNANTDWAQSLSTLSTCSFTVRVLVTVTPRYVTSQLGQLTSLFHPYGVDKSSTNLPGWGEGGRSPPSGGRYYCVIPLTIVVSRSSEVNFTKNYTLLYLFYDVLLVYGRVSHVTVKV